MNHLHLITSKYLDSFLIIMLVCGGLFFKKLSSLHLVRVDVGIDNLMIACVVYELINECSCCN